MRAFPYRRTMGGFMQRIVSASRNDNGSVGGRREYVPAKPSTPTLLFGYPAKLFIEVRGQQVEVEDWWESGLLDRPFVGEPRLNTSAIIDAIQAAEHGESV